MSLRRYYRQQTVLIQRESTHRDDFGGTISSYGLHLSIQGLVRPLSGREAMLCTKESLLTTHRLYCAPAAIVETDRVVSKGKIYNIAWVKDPMGMGKGLEIDLVAIGETSTGSGS